MVTVCASYMGSHVHRIIVLLLLSHLMHIQFDSLQMHIESRLQRASHERAFNPHYVIFFSLNMFLFMQLNGSLGVVCCSMLKH